MFLLDKLLKCFLSGYLFITCQMPIIILYYNYKDQNEKKTLCYPWQVEMHPAFIV